AQAKRPLGARRLDRLRIPLDLPLEPRKPLGRFPKAIRALLFLPHPPLEDRQSRQEVAGAAARNLLAGRGQEVPCPANPGVHAGLQRSPLLPLAHSGLPGLDRPLQSSEPLLRGLGTEILAQIAAVRGPGLELPREPAVRLDRKST